MRRREFIPLTAAPWPLAVRCTGTAASDAGGWGTGQFVSHDELIG